MRRCRVARYGFARDLGIFSFGWIGGIIGVFFLNYANPENELPLWQFFLESGPAILDFLLLGASIFLSIAILRRIAIGVWFE